MAYQKIGITNNNQVVVGENSVVCVLPVEIENKSLYELIELGYTSFYSPMFDGQLVVLDLLNFACVYLVGGSSGRGFTVASADYDHSLATCLNDGDYDNVVMLSDTITEVVQPAIGVGSLRCSNCPSSKIITLSGSFVPASNVNVGDKLCTLPSGFTIPNSAWFASAMISSELSPKALLVYRSTHPTLARNVYVQTALTAGVTYYINVVLAV